MIVDDPGDQIRHLGAGARAFFDRRGRHAAGGEHAAEQRAHQIRHRMGVQLLIRVHLVAVLLGKLVRHAQRLAVGHQQHAHGRQDHRQIGRERHLRERQRGQPLRQRAHDLHAILAVEIQRRAQGDGPEQHHQAGRNLLVPARQQEEQRQRGAPTAKATQLACGSSLMIPSSFSTVLPSGLGTPKSLLSCPTATKIARPVTKPSITGLDRNCVMKPSRAIPAARKTNPVTRTKADA